MKLGLKLTIWWHRFCAVIGGLIAIIAVGLGMLSSGGITVDPFIALVVFLVVGLAWLYWKVADLLSVYAAKGWWWAMILNMIGTFSLIGSFNQCPHTVSLIIPICPIIVIYLWLNRKLFGIGTE